jgi:hypothetical protein
MMLHVAVQSIAHFPLIFNYLHTFTYRKMQALWYLRNICTGFVSFCECPRQTISCRALIFGVRHGDPSTVENLSAHLVLPIKFLLTLYN